MYGYKEVTDKVERDEDKGFCDGCSDECNEDKGSVRVDKRNIEGEIDLEKVDEFSILNVSMKKINDAD
ncbi:hypothetical protein Tco_0899128 [Tanacetum coccineum]